VRGAGPVCQMPGLEKRETWGTQYSDLIPAMLSAGYRRNASSLHSTDHRFAMICSGRDDKVGGGGTAWG
jgi:hypothetical protein